MRNWKTKKLGEVCVIAAGNSAPQDKKLYVDGRYPFFRMSDVGRVHMHDNLCEVSDYLNDDGIKGLRLFKKGTLLFPKSGASTFLNHRVLMGCDGYVVSHLATLTPRDGMDSRFLFYLTQTLEAQKLVGDSSYPSLKTSTLDDVQILIPDIQEQKRIVKILDEKFQGVERLNKIVEQQIFDSKNLFESRLNEVFLNTSFKSTILGEHIEFLSGPAFKSQKYTNDSDSVKLLRGDNIINKAFRWDDVKKWSKSDIAQYERFLLREGDVVLAMDRPFVGYGLKHNIVNALDLPLLLVQRVARLRTKDSLNNTFLLHLISSKGFIDYLLRGQTGVSVPHISKKQIELFAFSLPTVKEQKQIAKELDELLEKTMKLDVLFRTTITDLEELKKSYLQQAFEGKL